MDKPSVKPGEWIKVSGNDCVVTHVYEEARHLEQGLWYSIRRSLQPMISTGMVSIGFSQKGLILVDTPKRATRMCAS